MPCRMGQTGSLVRTQFVDDVEDDARWLSVDPTSFVLPGQWSAFDPASSVHTASNTASLRGPFVSSQEETTAKEAAIDLERLEPLFGSMDDSLHEIHLFHQNAASSHDSHLSLLGEIQQNMIAKVTKVIRQSIHQGQSSGGNENEGFLLIQRMRILYRWYLSYQRHEAKKLNASGNQKNQSPPLNPQSLLPANLIMTSIFMSYLSRVSEADNSLLMELLAPVVQLLEDAKPLSFVDDGVSFHPIRSWILKCIRTGILVSSQSGNEWEQRAVSTAIGFISASGSLASILYLLSSYLNGPDRNIPLSSQSKMLLKQILSYNKVGMVFNKIEDKGPISALYAALNQPPARDPSLQKLHAFSTDGCYLYLVENDRIVKVGSGLQGTTRGEVFKWIPYTVSASTDDVKVQLVYFKKRLYLRTSAKDSLEIFDSDSLEALGSTGSLLLHPASSALVSDGDSLFVVSESGGDISLESIIIESSFSLGEKAKLGACTFEYPGNITICCDCKVLISMSYYSKEFKAGELCQDCYATRRAAEPFAAELKDLKHIRTPTTMFGSSNPPPIQIMQGQFLKRGRLLLCVLPPIKNYSSKTIIRIFDTKLACVVGDYSLLDIDPQSIFSLDHQQNRTFVLENSSRSLKIISHGSTGFIGTNGVMGIYDSLVAFEKEIDASGDSLPAHMIADLLLANLDKTISQHTNDPTKLARGAKSNEKPTSPRFMPFSVEATPETFSALSETLLSFIAQMPTSKSRRSSAFKKLTVLLNVLRLQLVAVSEAQTIPKNLESFFRLPKPLSADGISRDSFLTWSVDQVCEWLSSTVGMPEYRDAFQTNGVDGATLSLLDSSSLKELNVQQLSSRLKIQAAIKALQSKYSSAKKETTLSIRDVVQKTLSFLMDSEAETLGEDIGSDEDISLKEARKSCAVVYATLAKLCDSDTDRLRWYLDLHRKELKNRKLATATLPEIYEILGCGPCVIACLTSKDDSQESQEIQRECQSWVESLLDSLFMTQGDQKSSGTSQSDQLAVLSLLQKLVYSLYPSESQESNANPVYEWFCLEVIRRYRNVLYKPSTMRPFPLQVYNFFSTILHSTIFLMDSEGFGKISQVMVMLNESLSDVISSDQVLQGNHSNMAKPPKTQSAPIVFESKHPYDDNSDYDKIVHIPNATRLLVSFDPKCKTEEGYDYLKFFAKPDRSSPIGEKFHGPNTWPKKPLAISGDTFYYYFHSDGSRNDWGYKFTVIGELATQDIVFHDLFDLQRTLTWILSLYAARLLNPITVSLSPTPTTQIDLAEVEQILNTRLFSKRKEEEPKNSAFPASPEIEVDADASAFLESLVARRQPAFSFFENVFPRSKAWQTSSETQLNLEIILCAVLLKHGHLVSAAMKETSCPDSFPKEMKDILIRSINTIRSWIRLKRQSSSSSSLELTISTHADVSTPSMLESMLKKCNILLEMQANSSAVQTGSDFQSLCKEVLEFVQNFNHGDELREILHNSNQICESRLQGLNLFHSLITGSKSTTSQVDVIETFLKCFQSTPIVNPIKNEQMDTWTMWNHTAGIKGCDPLKLQELQAVFVRIIESIRDLWLQSPMDSRIQSSLVQFLTLEHDQTDDFFRSFSIFEILIDILSKVGSASPADLSVPSGTDQLPYIPQCTLVFVNMVSKSLSKAFSARVAEQDKATNTLLTKLVDLFAKKIALTTSNLKQAFSQQSQSLTISESQSEMELHTLALHLRKSLISSEQTLYMTLFSFGALAESLADHHADSMYQMVRPLLDVSVCGLSRCERVAIRCFRLLTAQAGASKTKDLSTAVSIHSTYNIGADLCRKLFKSPTDDDILLSCLLYYVGSLWASIPAPSSTEQTPVPGYVLLSRLAELVMTCRFLVNKRALASSLGHIFRATLESGADDILALTESKDSTTSTWNTFFGCLLVSGGFAETIRVGGHVTLPTTELCKYERRGVVLALDPTLTVATVAMFCEPIEFTSEYSTGQLTATDEIAPIGESALVDEESTSLLCKLLENIRRGLSRQSSLHKSWTLLRVQSLILKFAHAASQTLPEGQAKVMAQGFCKLSLKDFSPLTSCADVPVLTQAQAHTHLTRVECEWVNRRAEALQSISFEPKSMSELSKVEFCGSWCGINPKDDQEFVGVEKPQYIQDAILSYGKLKRLDLENWSLSASDCGELPASCLLAIPLDAQQNYRFSLRMLCSPALGAVQFGYVLDSCYQMPFFVSENAYGLSSDGKALNIRSNLPTLDAISCHETIHCDLISDKKCIRFTYEASGKELCLCVKKLEAAFFVIRISGADAVIAFQRLDLISSLDEKQIQTAISMNDLAEEDHHMLQVLQELAPTTCFELFQAVENPEHHLHTKMQQLFRESSAQSSSEAGKGKSKSKKKSKNKAASLTQAGQPPTRTIGVEPILDIITQEDVPTETTRAQALQSQTLPSDQTFQADAKVEVSPTSEQDSEWATEETLSNVSSTCEEEEQNEDEDEDEDVNELGDEEDEDEEDDNDEEDSSNSDQQSDQDTDPDILSESQEPAVNLVDGGGAIVEAHPAGSQHTDAPSHPRAQPRVVNERVPDFSIFRNDAPINFLSPDVFYGTFPDVDESSQSSSHSGSEESYDDDNDEDDDENENEKQGPEAFHLLSQSAYKPNLRSWAAVKLESPNTIFSPTPLSSGLVKEIKDEKSLLVLQDHPKFNMSVLMWCENRDLGHPQENLLQKSSLMTQVGCKLKPMYSPSLDTTPTIHRITPESMKIALELEFKRAGEYLASIQQLSCSHDLDEPENDCLDLRVLHDTIHNKHHFSFLRSGPSSGVLLDPITKQSLEVDKSFQVTLRHRLIEHMTAKTLSTKDAMWFLVDPRQRVLCRKLLKSIEKLSFATVLQEVSVCISLPWRSTLFHMWNSWKQQKEIETQSLDSTEIVDEIRRHLLFSSESGLACTAQPTAISKRENLHPMNSRGVKKMHISIPGATSISLTFHPKSAISMSSDMLALVTSTLGTRLEVSGLSQIFKHSDLADLRVIVSASEVELIVMSGADGDRWGIAVEATANSFAPQSRLALKSPEYAAWLLEQMTSMTPDTITPQMVGTLVPIIVATLTCSLPVNADATMWRLVRIVSSLLCLCDHQRPTLCFGEKHVEILQLHWKHLIAYRAKSSGSDKRADSLMKILLEFYFWISRCMGVEFEKILLAKKKDEGNQNKKRRNQQPRRRRRGRRRDDDDDSSYSDDDDDESSQDEDGGGTYDESSNEDLDSDLSDDDESQRSSSRRANRDQDNILQDVSFRQLFKAIDQKLDKKSVDLLELISRIGTAVDLLHSISGRQNCLDEVLDDAWVRSQQKSSVHESGHPLLRKPYSGSVSFPGAKSIQVTFHTKCNLPKNVTLKLTSKRAGTSNDETRTYSGDFGKNSNPHSFDGCELMWSTEEQIVHNGVRCDECSRYPIQGPRFKCLQCSNFDLCERCEANGAHDPSHVFLKVYRAPNRSLPADEKRLPLITSSTVHEDISCGRCGVGPIQGVRFACTSCDFNLCTQCEKFEDSHDPTHLFAKLNHPIDVSRLGNDRLWRFPPIYGEDSMWGFSFTASAIPSDEELEQLKTQAKLQRAETKANMMSWTSQMDQSLVTSLSRYSSDKGITLARFSSSLCRTAISQEHALQSYVGSEIRAMLAIILNQKWESVLKYIDYNSDPSRPSLWNTLVNFKYLIFTSSKNNFLEQTLEDMITSKSPHRVHLSRISSAQSTKVPKLTIFEQVLNQFRGVHAKKLWHSEHAFEVKLIGEGAEDAGGPYREAFSTLSHEMQSSSLNLFIPCPNQRSNHGKNRDKFLINPDCHASWAYEFIGRMMGVAVRTHDPLEIDLAPSFWKALINEKITVQDIIDTDAHFAQTLKMLKEPESVGLDEETFESTALAFTTFCNGIEVDLVPGGSQMAVTWENRLEYARLLEEYHIREGLSNIQIIRYGLADIIPISIISLYTSEEMEDMVCGRKEVDVEKLKLQTHYSDCNPSNQHIQFFWQVLEEFTQAQRAMFIKFVSGRSRIPRSAEHFKEFQINRFNASDNVDSYLPVAHTCFFSVDLPAYTSVEVTRAKLLLAIEHCHEIDADYMPNER